jgi:uncharacterized protein (TIGR03790 family)
MRCLLAPTARAIVVILTICSPAAALAGGGPEGVLLVVNPQSQSSMTIANHYVRLREIPPDNLLFIPWEPNIQTADVDTFRKRILVPVLQAIEARHLSDQIDYVVYSSDLPWGIALDADVRKFSGVLQAAAPPPSSKPGAKPNAQKPWVKPEWPKHLTPVGSLTGMTYLWQMAAVGHMAYFEMRSNHYARVMVPKQGVTPSAGFRGDRQYDAKGDVTAAEGRRYFLSMMLAVTAGRGNSLDEVIRYLQLSATADATHPKGTIYFLANTDVRSKVRDEFYPVVIEELGKLGVAAKLVEGTAPMHKDDVQGVMMGTPTFDWKATGSTILPGAICDNFTSFGGIMSIGGGQTPLSEFLRYGAAGASGTVTEPYAIAPKFPSPMLQLHYARGCSLAEAFYQSVSNPYQLLIVGDPLCRPWAKVPEVSVAGVEPKAVVSGPLTLKPTAKVAGDEAVEVFNLFIDGIRIAECKPEASFSIDTSKLADGYHELRVVAVGPAPIQSQGRKIIPVWTNNYGRAIEASLATKAPLRANMPLTIAVRSPGSVGVIAAQGSRIVGKAVGPEGQIEIPAKTLGAGPIRLRIMGLGEGDMQTNVIAAPLEFVVE